MAIQKLECGCTLDTDFVSQDHRSDGPPYHIVLKGNVQEAIPELPPPAEEEKHEDSKKLSWKKK